ATQQVSTPSGNVDWWVEALFAQCPSIVSPHGKFTVTKAATCGTNAAPALTSPIGGVQIQSPVDFNWTAVNGALLYRVWVSINGDPFVDLGVSRTTILKQQDLPSGTIQWYVDALFESCTPVASAKATFTIPQTTTCGGDAPLLV